MDASVTLAVTGILQYFLVTNFSLQSAFGIILLDRLQKTK